MEFIHFAHGSSFAYYSTTWVSSTTQLGLATQLFFKEICENFFVVIEFKNIEPEAPFGLFFKNMKKCWNPEKLRTLESHPNFTGSYKQDQRSTALT